MPTRPARHRPPAARLSDPRPSASVRGYGGHWRRLRLAWLREHPLCFICARCASEVDHLLAREKGGTDDPSNLRSLCKSCHSRKTVIVDGGFGRG